MDQLDPEQETKEKKKNSSSKKKILYFLLISLIIFLIIFFYIKSPKIKTENRRVIIFGYGPVSRTLIPVLDENLKVKEYIIYDKQDANENDIKTLIKSNTSINYIQKQFHTANFTNEVLNILQENDIIFDLFSRHSTISIIKAASQVKNILYFNAGIEEESDDSGACKDTEVLFNYTKFNKPIQTMVIGCGANPGMITHFAKLAIFHMAEEVINKNIFNNNDELKNLLKSKNLSALAEKLEIETVHVSELETNEVNDEKLVENFATNSWSIDTFIQECIINGEVSLNNEDIEYFNKNNLKYEKYDYFKYMYSTPSNIYIKTAYPFGIFTGKVTTHEEVVELSNLLSNNNHNVTCAFVYHPSRLGRKTLKFNQNKPQKLFTEENCGPLKGFEIMGATVISKNKKITARWYGSIVSCEESRNVGCKTNPTTLQVAAGLYSHLLYALDHTSMGIVQPNVFDSDKIMEYAKPYLGTIYDINLPFDISYKWEDLASTEEDMNYDL